MHSVAPLNRRWAMPKLDRPTRVMLLSIRTSSPKLAGDEKRAPGFDHRPADNAVRGDQLGFPLARQRPRLARAVEVSNIAK